MAPSDYPNIINPARWLFRQRARHTLISVGRKEVEVAFSLLLTFCITGHKKWCEFRLMSAEEPQRYAFLASFVLSQHAYYNHH